MPHLLATLVDGAGATGNSALITDFESLITGFFGSGFTSVLFAIAGVFVGFWLIRMVLRLVKGVASAGK